jgi:hypothetical protein
MWVMMSLMGGASPSTLVVAVRLSVSRLEAKAWWATWERRADQRCTSPETVATRACTGADRARALASSRMKARIPGQPICTGHLELALGRSVLWPVVLGGGLPRCRCHCAGEGPACCERRHQCCVNSKLSALEQRYAVGDDFDPPFRQVVQQRAGSSQPAKCWL